jgi:hypothetical protein
VILFLTTFSNHSLFSAEVFQNHSRAGLGRSKPFPPHLTARRTSPPPTDILGRRGVIHRDVTIDAAAQGAAGAHACDRRQGRSNVCRRFRKLAVNITRHRRSPSRSGASSRVFLRAALQPPPRIR